jgi:hypothetical protein
MSIFYITQRVSDPMAGTKDPLPADTRNCFCSSDHLFVLPLTIFVPPHMNHGSFREKHSFQSRCNRHVMKFLMCNIRCHHFTIIIYDLDVPRFTTFQLFVFSLVFLPKKHTAISTDINLLIIHAKHIDKFLGMVHVFRQLIRIQKDIPN